MQLGVISGGEEEIIVLRSSLLSGCRGRRSQGPNKSTQRAVEVERSVDQGQVGESLREIALLFSGLADLFCVQSEVIGIGERLLEVDPCFIEPAGSSQRLDRKSVV